MSQVSLHAADKFAQQEVAPRRRMDMPETWAEGLMWFKSAS